MYFSGLNYKYLKIYHKNIKHVFGWVERLKLIWFLILCEKNDKSIFNQELSKIIVNESRCR